jgi:hypothetical protein
MDNYHDHHRQSFYPCGLAVLFIEVSGSFFTKGFQGAKKWLRQMGYAEKWVSFAGGPTIRLVP